MSTKRLPAIAPGAVPARARSVVVRSLERIRAEDAQRIADGGSARYSDRSAIGVDANGAFANHIAKGGIFNDRTGRAAVGITLADVTDTRQALRAAGFAASIADVDAILTQATYEAWASSGAASPFTNTLESGVVAFVPRPKGEGPMGNTERQKRERERRALLGLCSRCPTSLARPAAVGKTVCDDCNAAAAERVRAGRAAKAGAK